MIDLVPVVRCKNCEKACKNIIGDMTVYDCDGRVVRADFFCADAVPGHPRNGVIEPESPIEQIDGMLKKMGMN